MDASQPPVPEDLKVRIKGTYDNIATDYNAWTERNTTTRGEFLATLMSLLPAGQVGNVSVLELGCGAMSTTKALLSLPNTTVIANDISTGQIEFGKKNLSEFAERVTWSEGDMMELSFPDGSLDAVVGMYSLIHLPREEQTELVARIGRWLKPGGYMLANFTSSDNSANIEPDWLAENGWMFWSGWGPERTAQMVRDAGLEVVTGELRGDAGDSTFFWVLAKKK